MGKKGVSLQSLLEAFELIAYAVNCCILEARYKLTFFFFLRDKY